MSRVLRLPGPETDCAVTEHALERYGQHVRPHLYGYPDELHADLVRMVRACGVVKPLPPDWVRHNWDGGGVSESELWIHCGDVALAVSATTGACRWAATTVLTRGGISDVARQSRNSKRSSRTHAHRRRNKLAHKLSRGARTMPETDPGE